ncbi:MAG TPA: NYN domain-containing protein [Trueperaceae bacterium]|nr:NYN domain-containing protein [Trueperaceae bacterium]HRQ10480.1 NYN domain-containing protein [Trueperaceae bacterium]
MPTTLGEEPGQRVALFVDTQNLYYAARDNHNASVDYERLLEAAVRGRRLAHADAYVVERDGDSSAYGFFGKLSALGYRVKRRKVRVHRVDDDGAVKLEGDWDMGIAAGIVRTFDHADVIVLASGDGDFAPILELAQERGKRVEVMAFREVAGQSLQDLADRFVGLGEVDGIFLPK